MIQKKKKLIVILSGCLIVLSLALAFIISDTKVDNPLPTNTNEPEVNEIVENETYKANKAINDDYIAEIKFESGLIDYPVLQGVSNDTYVTTEWKTMEYDIEGSIFMDYRNVYEGENEDKNLIIYGHYVYADESSKFSPLHLLKDQANYEANKYVTLTFANEIRRYEIADVFYCQLVDDGNGNYLFTEDNMQYHHTNFDSEYFKEYSKAIDEAKFYDTGVEITDKDHLLTLQTCVRDRDDLRLIVIAKEIERKPYTK